MIFSLGGWSPQLPTGFHVPRGTQDTHRASSRFTYRTVTVFGPAFQLILLPLLVPHLGPTTPTPTQKKHAKVKAQAKKKELLVLYVFLFLYLIPRLFSLCWGRFGLFPVRSPLLGESHLISLPPGTEMFHFPGFASYTYVFSI